MNNGGPRLLYQRTRRPSPGSLHCRDIELRLDDDGQHLLLSRYLELYSPEAGAQVQVRQHRVPLARVLRWMVAEGEG